MRSRRATMVGLAVALGGCVTDPAADGVADRAGSDRSESATWTPSAPPDVVVKNADTAPRRLDLSVTRDGEAVFDWTGRVAATETREFDALDTPPATYRVTATTDAGDDRLTWTVESCRTTRFVRVRIADGRPTLSVGAWTVVPRPACDTTEG